MAVLKCKMCGAALTVGDSDKFAQCQYCDSMQTLPNLDNELKMKLFERATELRLACDFDQAASVFQNIIAQFPDEAEAYWGLVLCKYGIEYVDDPRDGKKVPTCHRTRPQSVLNDPDFLAACDRADLAKWKYEEEAQVIDGLQQKILSISRAEEPYDVFICYKETDDVTRARTEDSATAQDIYTELIAKGYKVFFSRVTLRGKAGSEYEPYIYAALSSAKVMLVLGSKQDYFNAVWLKNEWSRYLEMMKDGDKVLIPCYDSITPEQLPRQLQGFQALNVRSITFLPDLFANIERVAGKTSVAPAVQVAPTAPAPVTDSNRKELNFDDGAYVGEAIGDRPHGYGTWYYANGDKYEGNWHLGIKKGQGIFTYASGDRYEGEFVDGKRHGRGVYTYASGSRYEGEFLNGKRHGRGVYVFADGNRYEGEWKEGNYHGQGTYTYASGETWTGEWKDDERWSGSGTILYYQDGKLTGGYYDGPLVEGKYHGKGVQVFSDGDRYEGEFVDGKRHGRGVYTYASGSRYEGEFVDGNFHGQGTFTYASGETWTGEWKDDKRFTGNGTILYYQDGKLTGGYYDGPLVEGKYHGKGVQVFSDGDRYEGEFVDGKRHGRGVYVFADGNRYEGEWKEGNYHGQGTYTYASGETWTGEWKDDERWSGSGTKLYYTDGKPNGERYEGDWKDGNFHGRGTLTYESGESWTGEWKDGAEFTGNGTILYYRDGKPTGARYDGALVEGKYHGKGVQVFSDGDRYEGEFIDDNYHGQGTYTYASGETWTGEWKDDERWNGHGTELYYTDGKPNGERYEGDWKDGNYHGQGTYTYASGETWTGEWKDDERWNGHGVHAFSDGDRYEGDWKDGNFHGRGTLTYESGESWTGEWKDGAEFTGNGTILYFRDGKPTGARYDGALVAGEYHGKGIQVFSDGGRYEGEFVNGMRNGQGVYAYASGDYYKGAFVDGKLHGQGALVYTNGDRYEGAFVNGQFHGQGTHTFADGKIWSGEWRNDELYNGTKRDAKGAVTAVCKNGKEKAKRSFGLF